MPKEKSQKKFKRDPLEVQLREDADPAVAAKLKKKNRNGRSGLRQFGGDDADRENDDNGVDEEALDGPDYIPDKMSKRILNQARRQTMEDEEEDDDDESGPGKRVRFAGASSNSSSRAAAVFSSADDDEEDEEEIVEFGDEDG